MTASSSSSERLPRTADPLALVLEHLRLAASGCLANPDDLAAAGASIDELLRIAVRLGAARLSASGAAVADLDQELTPTEAALICTRLLEEVELDLFELAMWKNWGRA
jgi:hypothetical protein